MIETILLEYLRGKLSVPVSMETPPSPPAEFIVMEKTGGGRVDGICSAMFAVQSNAQSLARAAEINEQVKAAMDDADALPEIAAVHFNTDYNFTNTASKRMRYQAVFDVFHY